MACLGVCVLQKSLSQISNSHIVLHPSSHQVLVNPQSGKRERVFVSLAAVYPTPEEPGSELSFEELWAANRGWLDQVWDDDSVALVADGSIPEIEELSGMVAERLVVHETVMLDENGAIKGKSKKMRKMEMNETQISMSLKAVPWQV